MKLFLQYLIDAINVGGLFALMALGIGLIFGIMRLINFAHGELVMAGGYAMFALIGLPAGAVIALSLAAVVVLALALERVAFRPLRDAAPSTLLVASFALSYFLQNFFVLAFGARPVPFTFAAGLATDLDIGPVRVAILQLVSVGLIVVALLSLTVLLKRTPIGIQLRAASQDFQAARLCGVRANWVIAFAFAISGALAWIVSLTYSAQIGQLSPGMGVRPVVIGFVATILGGLGSLVGAVVGGFFVGALSVVLEATLPLQVRPFKEAVLFSLVLLVLLLRPEGLVAVRALRERV